MAALTDPNRQTWVGGIFLEIAPITAILESLKDSDKTKFTEYLATVLTDDAVSVRYAAATVLGQLDDQQAAPELIKLLHDPDLGVCFAAAAALGRLGNQQAAPDLIKLLHDPNPNLRETAAAALGQLGDQQATPELIKLLHDQKPFVRPAAAAALERLGNEQGAPELIKFLHDPDPRIRDTAAAALGQLGNKQAASELINLLLDPDYMVRATAVASLGHLDDKQVAPEVVKLLLDSDPDVRARAATVLGQLDDKQVAPELVETLHDPDPGVRDTAVAALGQLGDKQVAPELINLLHAPDHEARAAAAIALGQLGDTQIAPELVKLLLDGDDDTRAAAATTIGQLGDKQAAPELIKSLRDFVPNVRAAVLAALLITGPVDLSTLPAILNRAYGNEEEVGETRFDAHLLGGGQPDVELAIGCLGKNAPASCQLVRLSSSDARRYLKVFRQVWDSSREYPAVRDDLAEKIAELARTQGWTSEDLWDLKYLRTEMLRQGGSSEVAANSIPTSPNYIFRWLVRYGYAGAAQPIFWIALIFLYPRFPSVQAIFFWNPRIRRFLGFGYVGLLLTWVPFLRNRLLAPFRDSLLADAESQNFDPEAYFAECSVVLTPGGHPEPIARAIPAIEGEIILEGESGLGKTMFLRSLAKRAERPMVYLTAQRCNGGVIEAIQDKLFGYAQDKTFLQSLVYSGGIDVAIDGLNEVSPDTRAQVSSFIEHYLRANVIVGTQPLEWTPPKTAKLYALQRLTQEQIRAFLLSREVILPDDAVRKGDEYKRACSCYLKGVFDSERTADAEENTSRMLSNPMDVTVVAEMLSRGEQPDLFRLREQQYRIMAADYKRTNLDQTFPFKAFSEYCYQLRLHDEVAISAQQFHKELLCMERHKLVVTRQSKGSDETVRIEWLFRHEKIMEFFIAQTFLGPGNDRPQQHMGDARFRGVFLLLATLLPLDAATVLRERLVDYAADTKDHTVSDTFVQLLRTRKAA